MSKKSVKYKSHSVAFKPNDWTLSEILRDFEYMVMNEEDAEECNQELKQKVDPRIFPLKFSGRILLKRDVDEDGLLMEVGDLLDKIQVFVSRGDLSKENFSFIKESNIGDVIGITGELHHSEYDGFSILASDIQLLAKCLNPLPDKVEDKYNERHLHLILDKEAAQRFQRRSLIIKNIRDILQEDGFIEVETPILDFDSNLRFSPGLYLKKLVIAGFENIFEIGKSFENKESTIAEFYKVHDSYIDFMNFIELVLNRSCCWVPKLRGPYTRMSMKAAINKFYSKGKGLVGLELVQAFKEHVQHKLVEPTFITQLPVEISPFAKRNNLDSTLTDSFELYVNGNLIANGLSVLTDSKDQSERLNDKDYRDYIQALEYGMPPTAGAEINIDKLVMYAQAQDDIKDVILFPVDNRTALREKGPDV